MLVYWSKYFEVEYEEDDVYYVGLAQGSPVVTDCDEVAMALVLMCQEVLTHARKTLPSYEPLAVASLAFNPAYRFIYPYLGIVCELKVPEIDTEGLDLLVIKEIKENGDICFEETMSGSTSPSRAVAAAAVASSADKPLDIFILSGQSNMAGRATLSELKQAATSSRVQSGDNPWASYIDPSTGDYESAYKGKVYTFLPKSLQWSSEVTPVNLHAETDILKEPGFGPGSALACAYIDGCRSSRRAANADALWLGENVGLIPTAVGATSLDEWCPTHGLKPPTPAAAKTAKYLPGCQNIFIAALRSTYSALRMAPPGSRVCGLIWYQGESDSGEKGLADSYAVRLASTMATFRRAVAVMHNLLRQATQAQTQVQGAGGEPIGLGLGSEVFSFPRELSMSSPTSPSSSGISSSRDRPYYQSLVPIVSVAITACRPVLTHMGTVRDHQLTTLGSTIPSPHAIVDAFGAPLTCDAIHINAEGSLRIGTVIGTTMLGLLTGFWDGDPYNQSCVVSTGCSLSPTNLVDGMVFDKVLSQVHESYKQKIARSRPEGRASSSSSPSSSSKLKSISSSSSSSGLGSASAARQLQFDYLAPSTSIASSPRKGGQSPVVRSGLKAQSFVQGTVSYCSVARVLALAAPKGAVSFADRR